MTPTFVTYALVDSWLHRLDPRAKLWFGLLGVLIGLVLHDPVPLAVILVLTHLLLAITGRIPLSVLGWMWRRIMPLLITILLLQPFFAPGQGEALFVIGPLRLTLMGVYAGVTLAVRAATIAFAAMTPVLTTPLEIMTRGLEKLGLPYTWSLTIGLAMRYLPTLFALYETIRQAQQARGWTPETRGFVERARAFLPTLVALIIAALRLSDALALGLAARGLGASKVRTYLRDIAMRPIDWGFMALATLVLGVIALWH